MNSQPSHTGPSIRLLWRVLTVLVLLGSGFTHFARAQESPRYYDFPYNHLPWYTLESEHFLIHFQSGNSRSAQVVSRVAEEVYPAITQLYHHEPDGKVSIVLKDREDYSNGASYFFDNKIDIWVPPLDTPLRGTHNWYRNVIAHEFTHMVQIQAAMKRTRKVPVIYLQWLSYEKVRRPDVLYGYPNGIITYPFSGVSVPAWLAEGTAQYQRRGFHFDTWDAHRDMVLRTRMLDGSYLDLTTMGTFTSKTSIEREVVYNQGYAFTIYLANRFGEDVLYKITQALSQRGVNNVAQAIKMATGEDGQNVFRDFVQDRTAYYRKAVAGLNLTPSRPVEKRGFFNFYPTWGPGGKKMAYLSNRGRDNSRVSLYLQSPNGEALKVSDVYDTRQAAEGESYTFSCGFSDKPTIDFITTAFSFSPDGQRIVYSRAAQNKYGELYRDLYLYDIQSHKSKQLTHDLRVQDPAWSPDGKHVAAVVQQDATLNLVLYNLEADSVQRLTHFKEGQQVFDPEWNHDGSALYFSFADSAQRSIRFLDLKSGHMEEVLGDPETDYRDASIGPEGRYLYYSADPDGIYNIYRLSLADGQQEQLTSVLGGAFMPSVNKNGELLFAEYKSGGYKISQVTLSALVASGSSSKYLSPDWSGSNGKQTGKKPEFAALNHFNDHDIQMLPKHDLAVADTGVYHFNLGTKGAGDARELYSYQSTTTGFSFYPVLRFDNYSKLNGSNYDLIKAGNFGDLGNNLVRDMKAGFYMSSREVIDRLNIFGGFMLGLGSRDASGLNDFFKPSRLVDLDRDMFLITEYQGLPFIKRSWSPTVSVELYNMHRNVKDGLSVEEFPCTSCLPDTTRSDIAYEIWEADLYLRSKINRWSMLELGIGYSPYRVITDGFISRELKQYVPGSTSQYYKGTKLSLAYDFEMDMPWRNSDVAPIGFRGYARYVYAPSKLLDNYEVNDGTLSPVYKSTNNHSFEFKVRDGFPLGRYSSGQLFGRFFSYLNNPDDYFYLDYIGGFTGLRSYPYFAVGGNTTAFAQVSYNFPLYRNINRQVGRYTLDKLYARLFLETGNGWGGPLDIGSNLKTGAGAELRFALNSYYLFPLKFFISGAYGFSRFSVNLPDDFITGSSSNTVNYGRDLQVHFGLTFDFEML